MLEMSGVNNFLQHGINFIFRYYSLSQISLSLSQIVQTIRHLGRITTWFPVQRWSLLYMRTKQDFVVRLAQF